MAALPEFKSEVFTVSRAKKRPALILGEEGPRVPRDLHKNKPKSQVAPTLLVAPFYGRDEGRGRAGYSEEFVERIRRCEYPQFVWDKLPLTGVDESILRLDHIQPVGSHYMAVELTEYRLGIDALGVFDEWLQWLIFGDYPKNGILDDTQKTIAEFF